MEGYTVDSNAADSDTNTKSDIPEGERHEAEETDLSLPDLPGDWEWRTANRNGLGKVNLYFGFDVNEPGGKLGEIDNYNEDGEEVWDITTRSIIPRGDTTVPQSDPNISEQFDSLDAAIEAVPEIIGTFCKLE